MTPVTAPLFLNTQSSTPMYRQIIEQMVAKVLAGDWAPGHALPSIRELAAACSVSVITVKRAYQELERSGLIVTRPARGSFVAERQELSTALLRADWTREFHALLERAARIGIRRDDIRQLLDAEPASPSDPSP